MEGATAAKEQRRSMRASMREELMKQYDEIQTEIALVAAGPGATTTRQKEGADQPAAGAAASSGRQPLHPPKQTAAAAALGFAVVFIDGRGTGLRSRAFREQSHKNLGDGSGGPDHPHVIRAMAKRWRYIDLDNIGIWGHSAGGYDSTHAILSHPEFYKAAVSSAGCHDNRMVPSRAYTMK